MGDLFLPDEPSASMTIAAIEKVAKGLSSGDRFRADLLPLFSAWVSADGREGVKKLVASLERRAALLTQEAQRLTRMRRFENDLLAQGHTLIAGVDEVGRGALAGPLAAAAVILPEGTAGLHGVDDSKKLTPKAREETFSRIVESALAWSVAFVSAEDIDARGMTWANQCAMTEAVRGLAPAAHAVISDAVHIEAGVPCLAITGGDRVSLSVAAASIVAKVHRDRLMSELAAEHPGYGFEGHKGYGSADHIASIHRLGPSRIHRASFLRGILQG